MSAETQGHPQPIDGSDVQYEGSRDDHEDKALMESTATTGGGGLRPKDVLDGEKQEKKKRDRKEPVSVTREPGKSLFPFSRVQKIIKVDRDLPMVAKEATLLISIATEEFIKRMAQAAQRVAEREKRVTIQHKDMTIVVRNVDQFMFLEEMIPWMVPQPAEKRKPKALEAKERSGPFAPTILDRFVLRTDAVEKRPDIRMNDDGTMAAEGNDEDI